MAVLPFQGPGGLEASAEVESLLAEAKQDGEPYFTVVDRQTLATAMNELKLHQTGLIDPRTAAKLGKFIGVEAIYTGTVFMPPPARQMTLQKRSSCASPSDSKKLVSICKSSVTTTVNCLSKVVQYTLVPRLVAVATGQVVYQANLTGEATDSSCADMGGEADDTMLRGQAAAQAFNQLKQDITPHIAQVNFTLKTQVADLSPEDQTRFSNAMAFAHDGRMDRACETWRDMAQATTSLSVRFNQAICDEADGQFEAALRHLQQLDHSLDRPDPDVDQALLRLQDEVATQRSSGGRPSPARPLGSPTASAATQS